MFLLYATAQSRKELKFKQRQAKLQIMFPALQIFLSFIFEINPLDFILVLYAFL